MKLILRKFLQGWSKMSLENSLENIKRFLKKRYKDNLAAIVVFGSANTGHYKDGESDIDLILLLKSKKRLNMEEERESLFEDFEKENAKIIHFKTLSNYEKHIYKKGSWSSWITIIDGSKKIYSTPEFQKFRKRLIFKPIPKKKLIEYLKTKDRFELEGYLKKEKGFVLTKGLFSHIRRKLQIINYFENQDIIFDYERCLDNINLVNDKKRKLEKLYSYYNKRKSLPKNGIKNYYKTAKDLTKRILKDI